MTRLCFIFPSDRLRPASHIVKTLPAWDAILCRLFNLLRGERRARGRQPCITSKNSARRQSCPAWIIDAENAAHHFARSIKAGHRLQVQINDLSGRWLDSQPSECERDPASHVIGLEGR